MSTQPPGATQPGPDNRWLYWTVGAVVVVLTVIGLITFSGANDDRQAQQKAEQLSQQLEKAGLTVPDQDIITRTLGTDGGNVCDNAASALGKATLHDQFTNGADFVGRRPVIVDSKLVLGEALILQTYCPEKLDEFRDAVKDLKFDDTIEE